MALAYLLTVAVSLTVLAVALRPRQAPPTPTPAPTTPAAGIPTDAHAEIHVILAAATQLAARLDTAA
jgi:hypothetical protein